MTLDGLPAIVDACTSADGFFGATVSALPSGARVVFAWATVAHVIESKGGSFHV